MKKPAKLKEIELSDLEKMALRGFAVRLGEIQEKHVEPLNREYAEFLRILERHYNLLSGDIGSKYLIDIPSGKLVPKPEVSGG